MAYKYLVIRHWEDDEQEEPTAEIMTASEIFTFMDMIDCFPCEVSMDIYRINGIGQAPTECTFRNCWHDPSDPLKMVIVGDGIREAGYGTDH